MEAQHALPKVSICIPTYNCETYIADAIKSALNQTYTNFELIVIDNHSTDGTEQIVRAIADSRLRYFQNETNIGMVRNWNRCIQLAKSEYIVVLSADDQLLPSMVQKSVSVLEKNRNVGLVFSSCYHIDKKGEIIKKLQPYKNNEVFDGTAFLEHHILGNFVYTPTVMVRKSCYEKLGGFDVALRHVFDWEMWLRIEMIYDVAYISEPLALYRVHDKSGSSLMTQELLYNDHRLVWKKMMSRCYKNVRLKNLISYKEYTYLKSEYFRGNIRPVSFLSSASRIISRNLWVLVKSRFGLAVGYCLVKRPLVNLKNLRARSYDSSIA